MEPEGRILEHLEFLYGEAIARQVWPELQDRLATFRQNSQGRNQVQPLSEKDIILIAYGDHMRLPGEPPLRTLAHFLIEYQSEAISGVHLLPFYPASSDDGFSVIDYRQVDPDLGDWGDVEAIGKHFRLMFDAVINHISRRSAWFTGFLEGEQRYRDYFITVDPVTDLSLVVRPRALPLLTEFQTRQGKQHVWTTFSEDQIDLNYANPRVLLEIVDLLLFYVAHGAEIIRLDAIAYLWKEVGSACIHLPETHRVVKLFRAALDSVAPGVILITETNVPHLENMSYFGEPLPGEERTDEAQMVYQFSLAPLTLHTFLTGNARALSDWAASLNTPAAGATFFNFTASHDGIGVRPAEGLLSPEEIQALVEMTEAHGGQVSYKTNADGTLSPYELNITLYDALNDPQQPQPDVDVRRFLASQVIMLSLAGVPGIYAHSLLGARNCYDCMERTGRARSINREKFQLDVLEAALRDPDSIHARVFSGYRRLLRIRREQPAFHPAGEQRVLDLPGDPAGDAAIFALVRTSPGGNQTILCLVNVSADAQRLTLKPSTAGLPDAHTWQDVIGGERYRVQNGVLELAMEGYGTLWLAPENGDS